MRKIKTYVSLATIVSLLVISVGCKSKSYPCPKNDSKRSAKLSDRDDDAAAPSNTKGTASKKDNGLIKKKEPKRIHKRK